jgi:hypothetical protein
LNSADSEPESPGRHRLRLRPAAAGGSLRWTPCQLSNTGESITGTVTVTPARAAKPRPGGYY